MSTMRRISASICSSVSLVAFIRFCVYAPVSKYHYAKNNGHILYEFGGNCGIIVRNNDIVDIKD